MTADADGFCDDCRVGTLVPVVVVDNSPMARMAQRKRERDFATEGEARAHEDMLDKAADAQDAYMKKWGLC
jgi:hypothetical protein